MINPVVRDRYKLSQYAEAVRRFEGMGLPECIGYSEKINFAVGLAMKNEITSTYAIYNFAVSVKRINNAMFEPIVRILNKILKGE